MLLFSYAVWRVWLSADWLTDLTDHSTTDRLSEKLWRKIPSKSQVSDRRCCCCCCCCSVLPRIQRRTNCIIISKLHDYIAGWRKMIKFRPIVRPSLNGLEMKDARFNEIVAGKIHSNCLSCVWTIQILFFFWRPLWILGPREIHWCL